MPITVEMQDIEVTTPTMEDDEISVIQPSMTDIELVPSGD